MRRAAIGTAVRALLVLLLAAWVVSVSGSPLPAAVGVLLVAPLLAQRRLPLLALFGTLASLLLTDVLGRTGGDDPFLFQLVWAAYGAGRWGSVRTQPWAAAVVLAFLSLNLMDTDPEVPASIVGPVLIVAAPWLLGLGAQFAAVRLQQMTTYAEALEMSREAEVRAAAHEERLRMARELHDVAAHSMSALSLQAQVLRRRAEAGAAVGADDVGALEAAAQAAMHELRAMVRVLRPLEYTEDQLEPQAGLDRLSALLEHCRTAGQQVDLRVDGEERPLPPGLSLQAFRILQEALTNARRHGGTGRVDVSLAWATDALLCQVTSPLPVVEVPRQRDGHGLVGMSERAASFGGSVTAGPDGAQWVVRAWLPLSL